ncbi:alkaline phosphatase family protein [candidate division CSSED10-310 bacterium]|uniref:Alkaline phosphatase family protein n=1 Tax=candidate division CSSED10-310 bacterium TaxID=2855610 RepID=A0ABV6YZK9_UNCC1
MKPRLLIIGLDGATPEFLFSLAQSGQLPHIRSLMQNGAHGKLRSTLPPLTPTAWTSFMTGVDPSSHGLFDFIELIPQHYEQSFANAHSRKKETIWSILHEAGLTIGLYNVPMTYPPEKLASFVISGMDAPGKNSPFVYPPKLKRELIRRFNTIPFDLRHLGFMRNNKIRHKVIAEIIETENLRLEIFQYLLEHYPADVAMIVFTATDTVQHFFWHNSDPNHFWYPGPHSPFYKVVEQVYSSIDQVLGKMLEHFNAPEECPVIIMSDHGFGPISKREFYPNRLLKRLGMLHLSGKKSSLFAHLDQFLRYFLPPHLKNELAARLPRLRCWWEAQATAMGDFEWSKTKAFALETLALPLGYYIHTKSRFPNGIVEDSQEYEQIVNQIQARLQELNLRGYHKSEIYQGEFAEYAPDIIIDWWSEGLVMKRSFPCPEDSPEIVIKGEYPENRSYWSGTHRTDGVVILSGSPFQSGTTLEDSSILDLAPTIFYLLGQNIPAHFEGRVLEQALASFSGIEKETRSNNGNASKIQKPQRIYSEDEEEIIKNRLKSLGYL